MMLLMKDLCKSIRMDGSPTHLDGDSDLRMLVALNVLFLRYWMWFFQDNLESRIMPKYLKWWRLLKYCLLCLILARMWL